MNRQSIALRVDQTIGNDPQGDVVRLFNFVRCVRHADTGIDGVCNLRIAVMN